MISFLEGTLAAKTVDAIVLQVGGIGFAIGMSATSLSAMPDTGAYVKVHTHLQVREDALTLYGFASQAEKNLFERLITVSGIGPKVALAALSAFAPDALAHVIVSGDTASVSRIPGVGKKTAARIVLELQGVLESSGGAGGVPVAPAGDTIGIVAEDLLAMGFTSIEADMALKGAAKDGSEADVLQYALKRLGA